MVDKAASSHEPVQITGRRNNAVLISEEDWRAKAPATSFVADWSQANARDREAAQLFLKSVWPKLKDASATYPAQITATTGRPRDLASSMRGRYDVR